MLNINSNLVPSTSSIFNCHNPKALKFITRLRLGLSHLHCALIADERKTFLNNINSINHEFQEQNDSTLTKDYFLGNPTSSVETKTLNAQCNNSIILSTKRFDEALL